MDPAGTHRGDECEGAKRKRSAQVLVLPNHPQQLFVHSSRHGGTAHCIGAERATGGGYGKPKDGSTPTVTESKPSPAPGTPTAWTVTASAFTGGPTPTHPDTLVPVYAVCAAP